MAIKYADRALKIKKNNPVSLINKSIAMKNLNKKEESMKLIKENMRRFKNSYQKSCAYAIIDDKNRMIKHLKKAIASK